MARKNFSILYSLRLILACAAFLSALAAFGTGIEFFFDLPSWQLGPLLATLVAQEDAFLWSALLCVLGYLVLTFCAGRVYCSCVCPLGILQDLLATILPRKRRTIGNYRKTRLVILAISLGLLIGGIAFCWRLLDPFSNFGKIVQGLFAPAYEFCYNFINPGSPLPQRVYTLSRQVIALIFLSILLLLVWRKRRIYCTTICPVGTLLGCISRHTCFPLTLKEEKCIKCGFCVNVCPADCINPVDATLDNERCLRCMKCIRVCPRSAIAFSLPRQTETPTVDEARRDFLLNGGTLAAAGAIALTTRAAVPASKDFVHFNNLAIVPPGAGSAARFASKCTNCLLCVTNCSGKVLRAPDDTHATIHLAFDQGMCEFTCNRCGNLCPTDAILPMPLEKKQRWRIGLANFDPSLCVAVQDETDCGACAEHCPTGALRMKEDAKGIRTPHLTAELCIGCGSCEYPCPVRPIKAIRVRACGVQTMAADPEEFFKRNAPQPQIPDSNSSEWLI